MSIDLREAPPVIAPVPRRRYIPHSDLPLPRLTGADVRRAGRLAGQVGAAAGRGVGRGLRWLVVAAWRRRTGVGLFVTSFAAYLTLGLVLALHYSSFAGDAQSRLANAYYVLFSRDPHLGAIGFVWNPLPSIAVMPLLLLKGIWPDLVSRAIAANIVSAAFMAGCVVLLHVMLKELNVRRGARLALAGAFALQPMIVMYGGNGMSEAMFMFFLLLTARRLARWLAAERTWDLVLAGAAAAFAYLTRIEAIPAVVAATGVVVAVSLVRAEGERRIRIRRAALLGFLFAAPAAFAFVVWSLISWVITGHPFEQISSQYGTASQLTAGGDAFDRERGNIALPRYIGLQLAGLAPLLPVVVAAAAWAALRRRDLRVLAPAAVLGGVVLFEVLAFLRGQTIGNVRYLIAAIPLCFLLTGCALMRPSADRGRWAWTRGGVAVIAVLAMAAPAAVGSALVMADKHLGRGEHQLIGYAFQLSSRDADYQPQDTSNAAVAVSRYLDGLDLPAGSVVLDNFDAGTVCTPLIILNSKRPRQFVIPNDRDFKPVLADPVIFGAKYLFAPKPTGRGAINEVNRTYPTLYKSGAGIADLEKEFHQTGCPTFRLYKLKPRATG
jgi:4-amino-4-deoxy-L-arabinose transferase-like glycosyltransferase